MAAPLSFLPSARPLTTLTHSEYTRTRTRSRVAANSLGAPPPNSEEEVVEQSLWRRVATVLASALLGEWGAHTEICPSTSRRSSTRSFSPC